MSFVIVYLYVLPACRVSGFATSVPGVVCLLPWINNLPYVC